MNSKLYLLILLIYCGALHSQTTSIPDPNFEQRLIDMNYDVPPVNGEVETDSINGILQLFVPNSSITDLTGIEDFAALEVLDISGNGISSLNLLSNSALRELYTETNPISQLDLSNNTALEIIRIGYMQLSSIDLSNNTAITELSCQNNQITALDVSGMTNLNFMICANNMLCELDLSNNTQMTTLICPGNRITRLDLNNGNNSIFNIMSGFNNDADICIQVDDPAAAAAGTGSYTNWVTDATATFSASCAIDPVIGLEGNSVVIAYGDDTPDVSDDTDYGIVPFGNFLEHTFTIHNNGIEDLNLTGSPSLVTVSGSTDFIVTSPPSTPISPGGSTSFTLRYEPSMAGTINVGTVTIENNDCDQNPFIYDVMGESSSTLGLTDFDRDGFSISPNPTNGPLQIQTNGNFTINSINIYDLNGKRLFSESYDNESRINLDLCHHSGLYIIEIQTSNSLVLKKLVIN